MRVLAVAAHPDDVEWLCGGTLALCAERGDEVFIAIATNGNVGTGDPTITREQIAHTRHEEAKASAAIIGATVIWMDFDDEWLFDNRETRERFIDAIREARPDIMFVLNENDYHPDHRLAGSIAIDCRIPVSVPLVKTKFPETPIPTVFVMDTIIGNGFDPEFFVDVTSVMETKKAMLSSHVSQVAWIDHVFGTEFTENMFIHARFRGIQAGYKYAEGFKLLHTWPHTGDMRLLPTAKK
ncbi:MAG: PIG-L family deacetylase [Actinomycetes bacterium]|nr:PIG-L family deacetylase [Actinomycetota bacterium]